MTSDHKSADQRRAPRFDTDLPVQVAGSEGDAQGSVPGNLRNVSASGAAIEFDPALGKSQVMFEIGDSIELHTDIKPTRGVVVRQDAGGIAIKFDQPEEALLAQIIDTVQKLIDRDA